MPVHTPASTDTTRTSCPARRAITALVTGLALVTLAALAAPATTQAQELFLRNAQIVDPSTRTVRNGSILIQDGRIAGFPAAAPAGFGGETMDLGGKWVIPALTDMHTHSFGNAAATGAPQFFGTAGTAQAALQAGVARFLDLFSPEDAILGLRNRQRTDGLPGAEILAAGPCLTATSGHCSEYGVPTRLVNTPEEARQQVAELAAKKPDVVKVVYDHQSYGGRRMPTIDKATLAAVVATAKEHGLKTVVHVGTWDDLRDAAAVGAAAATHTPWPDPVPEGLAAELEASGIMLIPTLAVQGDYSRYVEDPALLDSPLLNQVAATPLVDGYRVAPADTSRLGRWIGWQRDIAPGNLRSAGTLFRAGVPMLTGTDAGNPAVFQGYSVHREMALLVEAGLSAWDALASSTINPGVFFGRNWGIGVGAEASLVVLEASPVVDIRNTERIAAVIHKGKVIPTP